MSLSTLANSINPPTILAFSSAIGDRINKGEKIYNLTIGDFDPKIFPIPKAMITLTHQAYLAGETNYPGAHGMINTRKSIARFLNQKCGLDLNADELFLASGTRPFIYSAFRTVVNQGDKVIYPTPSWYNDQYCNILGAKVHTITTSPENNFLPTASQIKSCIDQAKLIVLCSPQNPTGTVFSEKELTDICNLIVNENKRRIADEKPLVYVFFDQVYWLLTHGETRFQHPLTLCPEIKPYAVFFDGMSKGFAATGLRVGWAYGPELILAKMRSIVAFMGAWAPRPEQIALADLLDDQVNLNAFVESFRARLAQRLSLIYNGFIKLRDQGYAVDAIKPQASIYLSVKLDLKAKVMENGKTLDNPQAIQHYILEEAKIGILPFSWFGCDENNYWFRISVGTCHSKDIDSIMANLQSALSKLTDG